MSESILDEWEKSAKSILYPSLNIRPEERILILLYRDRIMRNTLKHISAYSWTAKSVDLEKWINEFVDLSNQAIAEADKILETTNKGEIK